jgi:hypothetical protein
MKWICMLMVVALWPCAGAPALGQSTPQSDPIGAALIPPDVVMAHQEALGLSDAQRKAIQADAQSAQQRFTSAQWQLSAATEKLATVLGAAHVDQDRALAALDAVLVFERELKHTQLTLMIEVKNELSADQQARARTFVTNGSK